MDVGLHVWRNVVSDIVHDEQTVTEHHPLTVLNKCLHLLLKTHSYCSSLKTLNGTSMVCAQTPYKDVVVSWLKIFPGVCVGSIDGNVIEVYSDTRNIAEMRVDKEQLVKFYSEYMRHAYGVPVVITGMPVLAKDRYIMLPENKDLLKRVLEALTYAERLAQRISSGKIVCIRRGKTRVAISKQKNMYTKVIVSGEGLVNIEIEVVKSQPREILIDYTGISSRDFDVIFNIARPADYKFETLTPSMYSAAYIVNKILRRMRSEITKNAGESGPINLPFKRIAVMLYLALTGKSCSRLDKLSQ